MSLQLQLSCVQRACSHLAWSCSINCQVVWEQRGHYHSTGKSSKYVRKPMPRSFNRRMLQLAGRPMLQPVPSEMAARCNLNRRSRHAHQHSIVSSELDLALAAHVRRQLANFSAMAIYNRLHCSIPVSYHARNRMWMDGLHYKVYNNAAMKLALKGTRLSTLEPLFVGHTALVLAKDIGCIDKIVEAQERYPFLHLLACVAGGRILSVGECERLAAMAGDAAPAASTVALLHSVAGGLPHTLDASQTRLAALLHARLADLQLPADSDNT